jgi:hypothetical protein
VESVIDEPLGDVFDFDAARRFERAEVDDALVGDVSVFSFIENRVVRFEALGDVVRV